MDVPGGCWGFIGLGNMGAGMAKNVRQKMPSSSKLIVCELVTSQRDDFCSNVEGDVETAETPREIAEKCVCTYSIASRYCYCKIRSLTGTITIGHHHHLSTKCESSQDRLPRSLHGASGGMQR